MSRCAFALAILFLAGVIGGCADQSNKPASSADDSATQPAKLEEGFQIETESDGKMRTKPESMQRCRDLIDEIVQPVKDAFAAGEVEQQRRMKAEG